MDLSPEAQPRPAEGEGHVPEPVELLLEGRAQSQICIYTLILRRGDSTYWGL